jgi:hypothetical protein
LLLEIGLPLDVWLELIQEFGGALTKLLHHVRSLSSPLATERHQDGSDLQLDSMPVHGDAPSTL